MFLNYEYFLFAIPGMLVSMWAQTRISTAYAEASRHPGESWRDGRRGRGDGDAGRRRERRGD